MKRVYSNYIEVFVRGFDCTIKFYDHSPERDEIKGDKVEIKPESLVCEVVIATELVKKFIDVLLGTVKGRDPLILLKSRQAMN